MSANTRTIAYTYHPGSNDYTASTQADTDQSFAQECIEALPDYGLGFIISHPFSSWRPHREPTVKEKAARLECNEFLASQLDSYDEFHEMHNTPARTMYVLVAPPASMRNKSQWLLYLPWSHPTGTRYTIVGNLTNGFSLECVREYVIDEDQLHPPARRFAIGRVYGETVRDLLCYNYSATRVYLKMRPPEQGGGFVDSDPRTRLENVMWCGSVPNPLPVVCGMRPEQRLTPRSAAPELRIRDSQDWVRYLVGYLCGKGVVEAMPVECKDRREVHPLDVLGRVAQG